MEWIMVQISNLYPAPSIQAAGGIPRIYEGTPEMGHGVRARNTELSMSSLEARLTERFYLGILDKPSIITYNANK